MNRVIPFERQATTGIQRAIHRALSVDVRTQALRLGLALGQLGFSRSQCPPLWLNRDGNKVVGVHGAYATR